MYRTLSHAGRSSAADSYTCSNEDFPV